MHTFSLSSSSFVEEEHQTWYFFWMTLMMYMCYQYFRKMSNKYYLKFFITALLLMIAHRILRKFNSTGDKYAHLPDIEGWLQDQNSNFEMTAVLFLGTFCFILCI